MPAVNSVLVVGAGAAGAAAAIVLAEAGVAVEIAEIKPDVTALGSGITLQGNALRVMQRLGVWDAALGQGYCFDTLGIRAPDPAGTLVMEFPDARLGGPDLPATMGMYRPDLARLLLDRAVAVGVTVRYSTSVDKLASDDTGVDVAFTDGTSGRYDLVVGADGIRSHVRDLLGIDPGTRALGMGIFRAFTPRPASVTRTDLYYGGPSYIAGYCPTGEDSLYCYIVEAAQDRSGQSPEEMLADFRALSQAYHGPWDEIREVLTDPATVFYTKFETHVLPAPWNRGRVVLVGDAAHTCPPTLAQGAAMAFEDGVVLADMLVAADVVDDAFWQAFTDRRMPRAATVVELSNTLAQWQLDHVQGDMGAIIGRLAATVIPPA
ncbi:FAD-dependent monooxygenase [Kineosporia sp. A_224]|uniref:FAD-dependent monooxygenase n=1 Tax=Kineosporia sp. A_224 TaxID=1962180 RepID=UPI000B4BBADE|nr:FAD-dependent monooxygenase [Kineosporia sp. A_224]